jgi:hypothetical protein
MKRRAGGSDERKTTKSVLHFPNELFRDSERYCKTSIILKNQPFPPPTTASF